MKFTARITATCCFIGVALLAAASSASAATLTFSFSGTIGCLSGSTPPASCSDDLVLVGDPFSGTLTVDTAVLDSNGNIQIGQYANAVTGLTLNTGTLSLLASGGSVTIWDDYCSAPTCGPNPYQDKYEIPSFSGISDNSGGFNFNIALMLLQEPSASLPIGLVAGDSLNQTPVVISSVNQRYFSVDYWATTAGSSCQLAGAANCTKLKFTLDNFTSTPVPEPATLLLLGVGLVGIGYRMRRRA